MRKHTEKGGWNTLYQFVMENSTVPLTWTNSDST